MSAPEIDRHDDVFLLVCVAFVTVFVVAVMLGCSSPTLPVPADASPSDAGQDAAAPEDAPDDRPYAPEVPFVPCGPPWCVTPHRGHEEAALQAPTPPREGA